MKSLRLLLCVVAAAMFSAGNAYAQQSDRVFFSFNAANGLADNSAQTIKCTRTGRMVISTIGHVNFYDGGSFTHIDPTEKNVFPLPGYNGHYHMYFDRFHHLWLKDRRSVTCVDLLTERFIEDVGSVIRELGLKQHIDDMFGDSDSRLWFRYGNKLYSPDIQKELTVSRGRGFLQDVDVYADSILIEFFSNGSADAYELKSGRHLFATSAFTDSDSLNYASSSVLLMDGDCVFQIRNGAESGVLLCFNVAKRQWQRLLDTPYHLNNMAIFNGVLYIASEYGYWEYELVTGMKKHHEGLKLSRDRSLVTDVNTLCFDRQGGMWIGTERRGLLFSKAVSSPFLSYRLGDPAIADIQKMMDDKLQSLQDIVLPRHVNFRYVDSRGWQWEGTYNGLVLRKPNSKKAIVYTNHNGLMNNMVRSIIEDDDHNMWASTSYGISHLVIKGDVIQKHIETYTPFDNVPNESFIDGAAMKLSDGRLVMQSIDHIIILDPSRFKNDTISRIKLYPKLIRLLVNGQRIEAGREYDGRVILKRSITRVGELSVNYNQNSLSLTFSGLNYARPIQTYYRVRVKGVYDQWRLLSYSNSDGLVDSRGLLHLPLHGLAPGKYAIELQASMLPDYWPQEPFVWVINIEQPWWRSTGIYLLLALLLLIVALVNFFYFYRNTRLRLMVNNEEGELLKRIKSYADRCDSLTGEVLTPYSVSPAEYFGVREESDKEFVEAMLRIVPFINENKDSRINMKKLADLTGVNKEKLYELLAANLYKSPRQLAGRLRLQEVAKLLTETNISVEELAERYRFVSPNYLISSFYHQYRCTPSDYRNSNAL